MFWDVLSTKLETSFSSFFPTSPPPSCSRPFAGGHHGGKRWDHRVRTAGCGLLHPGAPFPPWSPCMWPWSEAPRSSVHGEGKTRTQLPGTQVRGV